MQITKINDNKLSKKKANIEDSVQELHFKNVICSITLQLFLFSKYNANLQIMWTEHLPITSELICHQEENSEWSPLVISVLHSYPKKHIFKKSKKLQLILFGFGKHDKKVTRKAFYIYLERT